MLVVVFAMLLFEEYVTRRTDLFGYFFVAQETMFHRSDTGNGEYKRRLATFFLERK